MCMCSVFSHACAHIWQIMCAGLDAGMCAHIQMSKNNAWTYVRLFLSVCVCAWTHDKESVSVSLMRPGLLKPRGSRGQLAAPCSQAGCTLLGHSLGLKPPSPAADIWRLSVWQTAEQYNKSVCSFPLLCSVWLWKHLIQVFWCYFFMSLVLQFPLLVRCDKKREITVLVFSKENVLSWDPLSKTKEKKN